MIHATLASERKQLQDGSFRYFHAALTMDTFGSFVVVVIVSGCRFSVSLKEQEPSRAVAIMTEAQAIAFEELDKWRLAP